MKRVALILVCLPLLSACVNDSIGMVLDSPDHAVSLIRKQPRFWEKKLELELVVARLPDCQRRHKLQPAALSPAFKVEVYAVAQNTFLIEQGRHLYLTETQTCEGFRRLDAPPEGGKGELLGVFREEQGKLVFAAAR